MPTTSLRRARLSTLALAAASSVTLAVLLRMRPALAGSPSAWRGDDLAFAAIWCVAVVCAAWLLLTTLACLVAITRGRPAIATRIARWAPPVVRRVLEVALVGTWAVLPTAAYAASPAPVTLHVGPGGRITTISGSRADDAPVVRAPRPTATTTTTTAAPRPARASTAVKPAPTPDLSWLAPEAPDEPPAALPAPLDSRVASHTHVVRAGDNLWRIAQAEVARATGSTRPDDPQVARYWRRVIETNRATLRSGDPSLIFPGELVVLPRIDR